MDVYLVLTQTEGKTHSSKSFSQRKHYYLYKQSNLYFRIKLGYDNEKISNNSDVTVIIDVVFGTIAFSVANKLCNLFDKIIGSFV